MSFCYFSWYFTHNNLVWNVATIFIHLKHSSVIIYFYLKLLLILCPNDYWQRQYYKLELMILITWLLITIRIEPKKDITHPWAKLLRFIKYLLIFTYIKCNLLFYNFFRSGEDEDTFWLEFSERDFQSVYETAHQVCQKGSGSKRRIQSEFEIFCPSYLT